MPIGPTYATFANTLVSKGFDFTFAPGVQPSVCLLSSVPHVNIPNVGLLTLKTEGDLTLTFRDCLVEDPRLMASTQGSYVQLPVKDRRWKWQFGAIYGHWNVPQANGGYIRETPPQALASMLLGQMGEINYDVSRLPNSTRPEKRWEGSLPAAELESLCAELGCVVVLNPLTDLVEIWPINAGTVLPTGFTTGKAYTPVQVATPDKIRVEGGYTKIQATWTCEAVGLDTDGKWKALANLSYNLPPKGFSGSAALNGFEGYWENQTYFADGKTLLVRDLAASTVFKCYRIKNIPTWTNGIVPPLLDGTFNQPASLQDFQFFDELATEEISPIDGGLRPMRAVAYARYVAPSGINFKQVSRYPHGFGFDPEQKIISFAEPLFLWGGNTVNSLPAEVYFECSFYAGANGVYHRRDVEANNANHSGTPTQVVQRPEIQGNLVYQFNATGGAAGSTNNFTDVDQRLQYWLAAEEDKYKLQQGGTINYDRLVAISPDGLTQQVSWSGGDGRPARTTASQAQRHNRFVKPLDEYRDRLTLKRQEVLLAQLAAGQLLRAMGGGL